MTMKSNNFIRKNKALERTQDNRKSLPSEKNVNLLVAEKTGYIPSVTKVIIRKLPQKGKIWVKEGETVEPSAIVGISHSSPGFRVFNISEILEIPPEKIFRCLVKSSGSKVFKGDVIAEDKKTFGLISRQFISPIDGIFEMVDPNRGQAMIQFMPIPIKLVAGVYGQVVKIVDEQEVHIKTTVDLITGALGSGIEREGVLRIVADSHEAIMMTNLDRSLAGSVIAGGSLMNKDIIQKAIALEVRGIVSGGINVRDYRSLVSSLNPIEDVGISLMATEGYGLGEIPFSIMEVLQKYNNRFVIINPRDKELIIPLMNEQSRKKERGKLASQLHYIKNDVTVRFLKSPYLGREGKVVEIKKDPIIFPSGIEAYGVVVEMAGGTRTIVPVRNLEIVHHND